jgi:hypothetical protein
MERVNCPKCGREIEIGKMTCEENVVGIPDHEVKFVSRKFEAVCPECGPVLCHSGGHHGTIARKELRDIFSKAEVSRLRAALPESERKVFNETLRGNRIAKDGEVNHWLEVLNGPRGRE